MPILTPARYFSRSLRTPVRSFNRRSLHKLLGGDAFADSLPSAPLPEGLLSVATLNPDLIGPSNYLDLASKKTVPIRFAASRSENVAGIRVAYVVSRSFPRNARGYMYYSQPPDAAPIGAVRFRLSKKNKPGAFGRARDDLRLVSGCCWQIMLPYIARLPKYAALLDQLLADNLVTEVQLARCRALFADETMVPEKTLFRLGQEFHVDFAEPMRFTAVVGDAVHHGELPGIFQTINDRGDPQRPWAGVGVAHFEPAHTTPNSDASTGPRRLLHLRFTHANDVRHATKGGRFKGLLKPRGGILLMTTRRGGLPPVPWVFDIDDCDSGSAGIALRALWDSSQVPEIADSSQMKPENESGKGTASDA
ncbi:hypothetical protein B0H14DRAFT_2799981 [Mycena olivaceomarginata]|nr:hypothetical protein B0H14DRAFT_2799981 [Mycena olivaceomarginata]